jgi:hypothetical protein
MMHKHTIALHKPWSHTSFFGLHIHEIVAKMRKAIRVEIPTGYQDETGFHLGVQSAEKEIKWPPV